jgi:hypothetical protein
VGVRQGHNVKVPRQTNITGETGIQDLYASGRGILALILFSSRTEAYS